jgi:predicted Rossmann-fold nucleotide-binding protein
MPRIPVVLFDEDYWRSVINFEALLEAGMISSKDLDLFCFADSAEEVWTQLLESGLSVGSPAPGAAPDVLGSRVGR